MAKTDFKSMPSPGGRGLSLPPERFAGGLSAAHGLSGQRLAADADTGSLAIGRESGTRDRE
jgi:hypothetical protein